MLRVKEELREMEEDPACSHGTESSPDAARAVKIEIDIGPTVLQPTDLHYIKMEPIKEEPQQMEEDPACSYDIESSLDAACAVKQEIDVGPTVLQRTDLRYMMMEPKLEMSNEETAQCRREDGGDNHILDKDTLLEHEKKPRAISEFKCDVCDKLFSKNYKLKRHMAKHTDQSGHYCEICQKFFELKGLLKRHMVKHTGQLDYSCEICKKCFARKDQLNLHMVTHNGQRDHRCEICEKCFILKNNLMKHKITHSGLRDHCCEICQKSFLRKQHLKEHMMIHTGQRDHACEICEKSFVRKEHLKTHMLTHTGQKDHCCEVCQIFFARNGDLKKHMITHTGQKDYRCENCKKCFTQKGALKRHMMGHFYTPKGKLINIYVPVDPVKEPPCITVVVSQAEGKNVQKESLDFSKPEQ